MMETSLRDYGRAQQDALKKEEDEDSVLSAPVTEPRPAEQPPRESAVDPFVQLFKKRLSQSAETDTTPTTTQLGSTPTAAAPAAPAAKPVDPFVQLFKTRLDQSQGAQPEAAPDNTATAFVGGVKQAASSVRTAWNVVSDDEEDVRTGAARAREIPKTQAQQEFMQNLQKRAKEDGDDSVMQAIKNVVGAAWENPRGAIHEVAAQLPNSGVIMGSMYTGAKIGTAVTAGNPAGAIAGGIIGLLFGNVAIETGFIAQEQVGEGEYDREDVLKKGGIKGGVISGIDVATMGATKLLFSAGYRAAHKASQEAVEKALKANNINPLDKAAVDAALTSDRSLLKTVQQAGAKAAAEAMPKGAKSAGLHGTALGLDMIGEGTGEYVGSVAAGLDASLTDAVLESLMSIPQSAGEVAVGKSFAKVKEKISPADALTNDPNSTAVDQSNRDEINNIGDFGETSEASQNKLEGIKQDLESSDPESLTIEQVEELINTPEHADIRPQLQALVAEKRVQAESGEQAEDTVDVAELERKFYEDPLDIDNTEAYWEVLTAESEQVAQSMAEGRFVPADTLRRHPDLVNEADIIEDVDRGQTAVEDQAGDERSIFQSTLNRIADHNKLEGPEREEFLKTRLDEYDAQAAETEAQAQADSKRENFAGAVGYIADKQNLKGPEREAFIQGRLDEYDAQAKAPTPSPYFKESDRAETVPLKDIQAREPLSTPEQKKSLEHAKKLMADAVAGKGEKRDPISVYEREDGVTVVVDGNTTYHALQELGEKNIAVNRVASPVQQSESMEEIYAQAEASRGDIKKVTENIATDFGGTAHFRPGEALKSKSRAQDKVDKKYGTPAKLKDILASTVSFPDQKQVMKALDGFLKNGAVVEVKNKFKNTPASGYRDISMTVRMPNGHLTEIQFTTDSLLKAKNAAGHVMYELSRELDKIDVPGAREVQARLDKLSREYYEAAFEAPANFNALSSDIGIPLYRISNELSESIKTRLSPSSLNNLRDLLSKTKGVPSESKKVSDIKSPPSSKKVTQSESGVKYITENKKVKVKALNKKGEVVSRLVPADKAIKDNARQRDSLEKLLICIE